MRFSKKIRSHARSRFQILVLLVALIVSIQPGPALAANSTASEAGLGAASAFCSLLYGPAKIVYAVMGLVFGGLAWGLSGGDADVREAVMMPAVRGDYVVTPSHLRGDRALEFIGRRPGYGRGAEVVEEEFEEPY